MTTPDWLDEQSTLEWERVSPKLFELDLLTEIDDAALVAYCVARSTYQRATLELQEPGHTGELSQRLPNPEPVDQHPQSGAQAIPLTPHANLE